MEQLVRVVATRDRFRQVTEAAGISADELLCVQYEPGRWAEAFRGTPSHLARFILAADEVLGAYDTALLASCVRSRGVDDATAYYFPGLELY